MAPPAPPAVVGVPRDCGIGIPGAHTGCRLRPELDCGRRHRRKQRRAPWRDGRGLQSCAHRKGAHRRHRRKRAVPARRPAPGPLQRHLQPGRVQERRARRPVAAGDLYRDGQRADERRRPRGNDYGHGRKPGRRRAADRGCHDVLEGSDGRDPDDPYAHELCGVHPGCAVQHRHGGRDWPCHQRSRRARQRAVRGADDDRRVRHPQHEQLGRRSILLLPEPGHDAGGDGHHRRRGRRVANGQHHDQRHSEGRWKHLRCHLQRRIQQRQHAGRQSQ